ncbi:hypothetical protein IK112_03810 [Candidatus Saccharibacteria bacterium]|nr:hypothetical protein [Candidatus Saccharibacteria bacterium]
MIKNNTIGLFYTPYAPQVARRYPLSYVFSGRYAWGNGNLGVQDSFGYWWSTTAYSDSNAYFLYVDSSTLTPQYNYNKANGFALR